MQDKLEELKLARPYKGRMPSTTPEQIRKARAMADEGISVAAIARALGVSQMSIYRGFQREELTRPTAQAEMVALRKFRAA